MWKKYNFFFFVLCFNLQVDVIVNTIAKDCDLSQGAVSNAILKKAGQKIQEEIYRKRYYGKGYPGADLYETKGYNLKCKEVFHTVCAIRSDPNAEKVDLLFISTLYSALFIFSCMLLSLTTVCLLLLSIDSFQSGLRMFEKSCFDTHIHLLPSYWYW